MPRTIAVFTELLGKSAEARLSYVIEWLQSHPLAAKAGAVWLLNPPDLPSDGLTINYGRSGPNSMPASSQILLAPPPGPTGVFLVAGHYEDKQLYGVTTSEQEAPRPFFTGNGFGFDVFSTLFFHLSRMEEYFPTGERSSLHGDFAEEQSLLVRHNLHHRPVADELALALYRCLGFSIPDRPTGFLISHDIDALRIWRTPFGVLRYLLWVGKRQKSIVGWPRIISDALQVFLFGKKDPADNFDRLLSTRTDLEKIIFFPAGGDTPFDKFYPLKKADGVLKKARTAGYALGLHPSYATWKNGRQMQEERDTLEAWAGEKVRYTRQHFLHFAFPETADLLEAAGFDTDHSLGYRNHYGFRCGTGFRYRLYNFNTESPYSWYEQPLALMDVGLMREIGLQKEALQPAWRAFFEANSMNTLVALNFHNTFFYEFVCYGWEMEEKYRELSGDVEGNIYIEVEERLKGGA